MGRLIHEIRCYPDRSRRPALLGGLPVWCEARAYPLTSILAKDQRTPTFYDWNEVCPPPAGFAFTTNIETAYTQPTLSFGSPSATFPLKEVFPSM